MCALFHFAAGVGDIKRISLFIGGSRVGGGIEKYSRVIPTVSNLIPTAEYNTSMTQIINWFLTSSAHPENYSLFFKSAAALAVLFGFDSIIVNEAGGEISNAVVGIGMIISSVTGLIGLYRKAKLGRWSAPSYSQD